MVTIESFVFFDIETTGLPFQERNQTKIIEICMVAASRRELLCCEWGNIPPVRKITYIFNPRRKIHPEVTKLTGLSRQKLLFAPKFNEKINGLLSFLEELPKPVCLVAHNGNVFDFKLLQNEFLDAKVALPCYLFCVDSLIGFRRLLRDVDFTTLSATAQDLLTDDEDDEIWPDLDLTPEDWLQIDNLSLDETCNENDSKKIGRKKASSKTGRKGSVQKGCKQMEKQRFNLSSLYKKLLAKEPTNAHQAEADCLMLLECVVAVKGFIPWADSQCQPLSNIKPYQRY